MSASNKKDIPVNANKNTPEKSSWATSQHPLADMERAFDRYFVRNWLPRPWIDFLSLDKDFEQTGLRIVNLDLVDRNSEIFVRAEMPGIDKKDIKISLTDNLLTIKGESKHEKKEEKGDFHRREISSASFARSVMLPANVDASKVVANLKDGVLEVTLPKLEKSKQHQIEVK
jgi:HSP20 family protein